MNIHTITFVLSLLLLQDCEAFSISGGRVTSTSSTALFHSDKPDSAHTVDHVLHTESRRNLLRNLAVGVSICSFPSAVNASGGATAGGAYLLSAKQRYNDRVLKGVATFVAIRPALEKGDIDAVREFFTSEDAGAWKDFSAAGYLLANAFRRSSSTPPDSLPSVQKWKAFAADVEGMTKSLKKKDTKTALVSYDSALTKLDVYLTQAVELPAVKEL